MKMFDQEVLVTLIDKRILKTTIPVNIMVFDNRESSIRSAIISAARYGFWHPEKNIFIAPAGIFSIALPTKDTTNGERDKPAGKVVRS